MQAVTLNIIYSVPGMQAKAIDKMPSTCCTSLKISERLKGLAYLGYILRLHFWSLVTYWLYANDNICAAKLRI